MQEASLRQHLHQDHKTRETRQHFLIARTKQILRYPTLADQDMDPEVLQVPLLHPDLRQELQVTIVIRLLVQHQTIYDHHHIQVRKNNIYAI